MKAVVLSLFLSLIGPARGQVLDYTEGHMDVAMSYNGTSFVGWWKNDGATVNGTVTFGDYLAPQIRAVAVFDEVTPPPIRPAGAQWDFLGVAAGEPVYILPSSGIPSTVPYLGFSTELPSVAVFEEITISLTGFSGPSGSTFALYSSSSNIPMQFFQGNILGAMLTLEPGNHEHFNWSFSHPGSYTLTFTFSGLLGNATVSGSADYGFLIVPEPSGLSLLFLGAGLFWLLRTRLGTRDSAQTA